MSERRWDPIQLPPSQLDEQIERAFEELLTAPWLSESRDWLPQLDVTETPREFIMDADLPGVGLDELRIRTEGRSVTICGSRSDRRAESKEGVILVERRHGAFCRRVTLREPVSGEGIKVTQEHGVFRIRLPKLASQEQP